MRSINEYYSSVNNVSEGIQTESGALYVGIRWLYYENSSAILITVAVTFDCAY